MGPCREYYISIGTLFQAGSQNFSAVSAMPSIFFASPLQSDYIPVLRLRSAIDKKVTTFQ
jgi:hypothetical protein